MDDTDSSEASNEATTCYKAMRREDLLALAICAIREHRRLLAADQVVYEAWTRAAADSSACEATLRNLQNEYLHRQKASETQQEELANIIDALGYVPDVPLDDID